jgi:hypothetical protein
MKKDGFEICCHSHAEPVLDPIGDGNPESAKMIENTIRFRIKSGMTKNGMVHARYGGSSCGA